VENLLPKGLLGSSRRPIVAGAAALILATILLLVYLSHYRNSVQSSNSTASVLVAQAFIPKGTSSLEVAQKGTWEITAIAKDDVKEGAVSDAAVFQGQVALDDIYPAQQVTVADFGVTPTSATLSASPELLGTGRTAGSWRAVAIPLDSSHGISPQAQTGDHVDVYTQSGGTMSLLMQNVLILAAPNQAATNTTSPASENYILRVPIPMVARFTFASDNAKIWFALRPQRGSKPASRTSVTSSNLIPG
jgi:Flp pilus assembly protein CpaB